jgi:Ca2+/Na+ antiporter
MDASFYFIRSLVQTFSIFIVLFMYLYIFYAFLLLSISLPCELQASEGRLHLALFQARHTHGSSVYLARASQLLNITHTNQTCV